MTLQNAKPGRMVPTQAVAVTTMPLPSSQELICTPTFAHYVLLSDRDLESQGWMYITHHFGERLAREEWVSTYAPWLRGELVDSYPCCLHP